MTTRDFTANVISATKVVPDGNFKNSAASGVWDINEALDLIKGGNWPNAANIDPSSFVDVLFSTDLIVGATDTARTITNGIDLSTKKGFVWGVSRTAADNRRLSNTVRGASETLDTGNTYAEFDNAGVQGATQFNSNGFVSGMTNSYYNNEDIVYWTFREQPKFFDLVQFSGTGSAQNISHSLGSVPGMIWVKRVDSTGDWAVYHRGFDSSAPEDYIAFLNKTTAIADNDQYWNDTAPTSSVFTVGTNSAVNASGGTYIAFIFAHNNDDGGFGEPGDQDIIKCGSFTGNSSADVTVDVGFEPQFLLTFRTGGSNWNVVDNLRGIATGGVDPTIFADTGGAENTAADRIDLTSTGFIQKSGQTGNETVVYMAIRRGGMETPTTPSDVFAIDQGINQTSNGVQVFDAGFPVDILFRTRPNTTYNNLWLTRLTGDSKYLLSNSTAAEQSTAYGNQFDSNTGIISQTAFDWSQHYAWMWKRARGFCDIVAFSGDGSSTASNRTAAISHNLGVQPEMIWVKRRDSTSEWVVAHKDYGAGYLNLSNAFATYSSMSTTHNDNFTATNFKIGAWQQEGNFNVDGADYIAFLFASISGLCKIGSYTGNSSSTQDIDCGFTNGAKMVILKQASHSEAWEIYDTTRGLVAGNDNRLRLNTDSAEATNSDFIDPLDSGFTAVADSNFDGRTYLFYAIANDPS